MEESRQKKILLSAGILIVILVALWWFSGFSLDFMKFFAAAPTESPILSLVPTSTATATPANIGQAIGCSPATQTVALSGKATLSVSGGGGTYIWSAPDGSPSSGQGIQFVTQYTTTGTKMITVESVRNVNGVSIDDSVACSVIVTQ